MSEPHPSLPPLEVYLLGLVPFEDAQRLQRRLVYDLGESGRGATLVLCEHPPTITVGRSGSRAHILPDDEELQSNGLSVRWVNRGGGCELHLPGQLMLYLAMPLEPFGLTVGTYLDRLHDVMIEVLADFDLRGQRRPDRTGIDLAGAPVCRVGIAVNRYIAYHGLTLNVGPYLPAFDLIDDPRETGRPTSMESRRQRPAPMSRVRQAVITRLSEGFGLDPRHVYTDHPMIRRKAPVHAYASSSG